MIGGSVVASQLEVTQLGKKLIDQIQDRQIVLLDGPLGSGKTFLVSECFRALGLSGSTSPTFSWIQNLKTSDGRSVYHIDLYRLEEPEELESIAFWDIFQEKRAVVFIEWSSRLDWRDLPFDWSVDRIVIELTADTQQRQYHLEKLR
jgi:tRNA threonylcarbamoyl adenosine modification protein YjeE